MIDKIHYDKDLEKYVVGMCLIDTSAYDQIAMILKPHHFYDADYKTIFKVICDIKEAGQVIDLMTVAHWCFSKEKMPRDMIAVIMQTTNAVTSIASLMQNAYLIVQMYRKREVERITKSGISPDMDINDAISHLEAQISALRTESVISAIDMNEAIMRLAKYQDQVSSLDMLGISTGFKTIDDATSGFVGGGLYVVAARPSVGKSAFMGRNVLGAAMTGKAVGIIQLEMSIEQSIGRLSSLYTDISYQKIITGFRYDDSVRDKFYDIMGKMANLPITINPSINLNIEAIKSFCYALNRKGKLDILFIDYLQLIDQKGGRSREQEVATISRGLKLLARDLNIPVIALSQLNRGVESRSIKKPILSDLRESGSIEQDADTVMFLHRDEAMGIETDENGNSTKGKAELIIAKNRNGSRMTIPLHFDGERMKFTDYDTNPIRS
jgi:replicative DNA helicase